MEVVLIENNAYDRAVLDICLMMDSDLRLRYTTEDESSPIGPTALWQLLSDETNPKPNLVLFDLALTPWCGRVLASSEYRDILRNGSQGLRKMDIVLRDHSHKQRRALTELTIALRASAEAEAADTPNLAETVLSHPTLNNLLANSDSSRLIRVLETAAERVRSRESFGSSLEDLTYTLWDSEPTAWEISRSPSVLRFFLCATSFPEVCFGVASHFADSDSRLALRTVLGARSAIPWPTERDSLLDGLIVNKAELFSSQDAQTSGTRPLAIRLRKAVIDWKTLGSPSATTAPFGNLPIVQAGSSHGTQKADLTFAQWCSDYLPKATGQRAVTEDPSTPLCTVLLDQTLLIAGGDQAANAWTICGHEGWYTLANRHIVSIHESFSDVNFQDSHSRLYIIRNKVSKNQAIEFSSNLASGSKPGRPCCVIIGSLDKDVAKELEDHDSDLQLFRVVAPEDWPKGPFFFKGRKNKIARSLVEMLRVRGSHDVHTFLSTVNRPDLDTLVKKIGKHLLDSGKSINVEFEKVVRNARSIEEKLSEGLDIDDILTELELGMKLTNF